MQRMCRISKIKYKYVLLSDIMTRVFEEGNLLFITEN